MASQLRNQNGLAEANAPLGDDAEDINAASSLTINRFDQLEEKELVHPNIVRAITKDMGHHTMTEVQSATINQALNGTDM